VDPLNEGARADERRFVISGRVQGVGYRWFVREQARRLGVRGWVRNEHDGSVVVEAAASAAALAEFAGQLGQGPAGASVAAVDSAPRASASPLPDGFHIVR
jgi:acylphosphatase